ncbi:MAG: hypothetical protein IPG82_00970 [Saprospiraceae bacterium]|nr:hypothetical protein [Saprospiraceae bacterium]MBK7437148.1 hypothetical protein [Saprospiraceae bacterium]
MIKKFGYILFCGILFYLLYACKEKSRSIEYEKNELLTLDRRMSALAEKEGFNQAILFFADDSIVKFNEGKLPILGKKSYDSSFDNSHDTHAISWYPLAAEVAASFDLGYTWGNWKYAAIDTTMYGNYFTVWKKQADGSWKVKLDGGNNTPKPGLL